MFSPTSYVYRMSAFFFSRCDNEVYCLPYFVRDGLILSVNRIILIEKVKILMLILFNKKLEKLNKKDHF